MNWGNRHKDKRNGKKQGWAVKNERPEEYLTGPHEYYTDLEIESYARSGGMKRAQQQLAYRILDLLGLEKGKKLLDLGCGSGYTMDVYASEGYNVAGLDIVPGMVSKAKSKGLNVTEGDMTKLKDIFQENEFDGVVSASALQWIKDNDRLKEVIKGIYHVLKENGRTVIQFYPKSYNEVVQISRMFKKQGFEGEAVIDNEDDPRKRTVYLVFKKV